MTRGLETITPYIVEKNMNLLNRLLGRKQPDVLNQQQPEAEPAAPPDGGVASDSPIISPAQDVFGIDPFARTLAASIAKVGAKDGLVFAINGAWGSGKSSAVNLVVHHLGDEFIDEDIVIVTFNPWWFSDAEALTVSFFQELRASVGKSLSESAREAMASLGNRLSAAGPFLGGIASLIATPAAGSAVMGASSLIDKFIKLDSTVQQEHRKLVDPLASQTTRFLIVIDDIDRLSTDDALQVFKLIKSVGRLPNVIYLLAFDRNLAEKMISERFPAEGTSYLDKIVQGAFDLPLPDREDLQSQVLQVVQDTMGSPIESKMVRFMNLFYDAVAPFLSTPRDAVRLTNAIRVSWSAVSGEVDRADYLDLIAGLLLVPFATPAMAAVKQISILHSGFPNRTPIHVLIDALRARGYEDGTAAIELLGAEGDAQRLDTLVTGLVSKKPDVIIALTSPAVLALKQAGVVTPVVFAFVTDPVRQGIVASLSHPGGNFTGVTYSEATLGGKRLDLLLDALPGTRHIAVIWSRSFPENAAIFDVIRQAAQARGVEVFPKELEGVQDLASAFDYSKNAGAQALIFITDNLMFGRRKEIAALALSHHLPSIHSFTPEVEDGGLMSYGPDLGESYRGTAALADKVLKGAHPANLPVEEPTQFSLCINLKTAKALGLTIPPMFLARADQVIE